MEEGVPSEWGYTDSYESDYTETPFDERLLKYPEHQLDDPSFIDYTKERKIDEEENFKPWDEIKYFNNIGELKKIIDENTERVDEITFKYTKGLIRLQRDAKKVEGAVFLKDKKCDNK